MGGGDLRVAAGKEAVLATYWFLNEEMSFGLVVSDFVISCVTNQPSGETFCSQISVFRLNCVMQGQVTKFSLY